MNTENNQEDVFTEKQDIITDILLETFKKGGIDDVRAMIRLAIINFADECSIEDREETIDMLVEAIKTPLFLHQVQQETRKPKKK